MKQRSEIDQLRDRIKASQRMPQSFGQLFNNNIEEFYEVYETRLREKLCEKARHHRPENFGTGLEEL